LEYSKFFQRDEEDIHFIKDDHSLIVRGRLYINFRDMRRSERKCNVRILIIEDNEEMVIDTDGHSLNDRFCAFHLFSLEDLFRKKMKEYCRPEQWFDQRKGIMLSAAWLQADRKTIPEGKMTKLNDRSQLNASEVLLQLKSNTDP